MRRRDPFGDAVASIRARVRSGETAPGAPLIVEDLARDLSLSSTPVREALAYLSGRGVIAPRSLGNRGYSAWTIDPVGLIGLYELQAELIAFAIRHADSAITLPPGDQPLNATVAERTERAFTALARRAGNTSLSQTLATLSDRLHLPRLAEFVALSDLEEELAALEAPAQAGLPSVDVLDAYVARRRAAAASIDRAVRLIVEMQVGGEGQVSEI